jgi:hypothetical protein
MFVYYFHFNLNRTWQLKKRLLRDRGLIASITSDRVIKRFRIANATNDNLFL